MAADVAVAPHNRIPISGGNSSETVSPSAYMRHIDSVVTPDFTSVTNSRERFVVLVMSTLLLLISCTLFAVLFTLLSDDRTSAKSQEAIVPGLIFFYQALMEIVREMRKGRDYDY
ncbi:uncharacterized protein [Dermacentor andersoni]|uniref:uncharacterized protein isoform X2 n=1 Tax=Dermacentor andersoni TaxID=34620 RepID=UPI0024164AD3|nr:uncharacterized protein LOC126524759 isoform X1 [Dermacentor andersoni]